MSKELFQVGDTCWMIGDAPSPPPIQGTVEMIHYNDGGSVQSIAVSADGQFYCVQPCALFHLEPSALAEIAREKS